MIVTDTLTLALSPQGRGEEQAAREQVIPVPERVFVLGAGKGAGFLAQGLEAVLGDHIAGGVVVLPRGQNVQLERIDLVHGEHPLPGPGSLAGAERMQSVLTQKSEHDLVCFCLTGGASSLLVSPAPGISLADKLATNRLLIECGADIHAINTVRKHLSTIKGGGLARWAFPSPLVSFVLSDVIGDDLSTIGSGPTVPDPTTFAEAWNVIEQFALIDRLPASVREHLRRGTAGQSEETPKPGDPIFSHVSNILIGSNRLALEAAATAARALGYSPFIVEEPLSGDTTTAAATFAAHLHTALAKGDDPVCVLAGGETTVHVTGTGKGGRNQEFALVVAQALRSEPGKSRKLHWTLLSAGTDGIDGPTDAAGAFVDGNTLRRADTAGLDSHAALQNNDSYPFFAALDDLFRPGQTGTNVMDIKIALLWP
ncbi:MAG: DUF4147 domain-containing protein [Deltaproteobacteria bacterium]|nr:DUF4147 domain-containing protein [Deltaproteobacteria bacterium]